MERVGRHDNFFELGGHSIRTIIIIAKAGQLGLGISVNQMFRHQTIASLAASLEPDLPLVSDRTDLARTQVLPYTLISESDKSLLPDDVDDAYGLTRLQSGMIFHNQLSPELGMYHDVFSYHIRSKDWDHSAFELVLNALAKKHAILRTSISLNGYSEPLQLIHRDATVPVIVRDIADFAPSVQDKIIEDFIQDEKKRPLDLETPPLLRIFLHRRSSESFQYSLSFHHAILDGWSVASFHTELFREYSLLCGKKEKRLTLEPLASSFSAAVACEREALQSESMRLFWADQLADYPPSTLPPYLQDDKGRGTGSFQLSIPSGLRDSLGRLAASLGVQVRTLLLVAHLRTMSTLSGNYDVVTGVVSHIRPEELDGEKTLGIFLNTLPFPS